MTVSSVYPCDSDSVIKQISYSNVPDSRITCNGIIVNGTYDVIFNNPGKWRNGNWVPAMEIHFGALLLTRLTTRRGVSVMVS